MIISSIEVERWNKYYRDEHGIACSFEGLEIPAEAKYPTRLIVMHSDVSNRPQRIANAYRKRCGDKWCQYDDLDIAMSKHDRFGTYAVRVADVPEAPDGYDEKAQENLSSQDVWARAWVTTTLPERLVDGDICLWEHRIFLDRGGGSTLCPGSRDSSGCVPGVRLSEKGVVRVECWPPYASGCNIRFRRVIVRHAPLVLLPSRSHFKN